MALFDYFTIGGVEVANAARLNAYLETEAVGSPLTQASVCVCPTLTAEVLGDEPYVDPATDDAPWYDASVPESAEFAGFLVLSMEGLDEFPVRRSVTNAITGGGVLGPARVLPRTIVVTGILLGATCCGVEYGWHWLQEVLQGCTGQQCGGDCMDLFACCPAEEMTEAEFQSAHGRRLREVALVDGPRVTDRIGNGCTAGGECSSGADILTVEFTLVAATPWLYTDPLPVLSTFLPLDESGDCITWCLKGGPTVCIEVSSGCIIGAPVVAAGSCGDVEWPVDDYPCASVCRLAACVDATESCSDSACQPPAPPTVAELGTCFCVPLAVERDCYDVDLTGQPAWSVDTPTFTIIAGSKEVRNVRITVYERTEKEVALTLDQLTALKRCSPLAEFIVTYVPAGGTLTLDGQVGRALISCGGRCQTSPDVYGADGGPVVFPRMDCARYVVCIETDVMNPPAPEAMFTLSLSGRGY
ncbi:hypothetical protein ACFWVB_20195 [Streptomyces microflavus]|uniref:hypothetical protein n=1 Tax=Streptomyces microflavus TaxID=1919 RepID=UPI00365CE9CF